MGQPIDRTGRPFAPLGTFEEVFPQLEDGTMEYTEFDFANDARKGTQRLRIHGGLIRCGNPRCFRGGYEVDFKVHEMVRTGVWEQAFEIPCPGDEGTAKRRSPTRLCTRRIKVLVKLTPKKQ